MISKFYGNFSEWLTFWNSFDAAIHQNNSLNPIDKFNYLKSHLGGTALNTVEGFALSADNYEKAIKLLKDRFGREDILISRHMNNLLSMRPLKTSSDVRTFRELFDNLSVHIRSLESLNVSIDVYGQLLCPIIIKLLPADLNLELNKELPTGYVINDLITFLERQLTAREKSFRNEIGTGNESTSKPNLVTKHPKTRFYNEKPIATASELLNSVHKSNECVFCGKDNHGSPKCDFAANISLNEKRSLMKKKGVCYKCLRPSHLSKFCRNVVRCSICNMSSHLDVMCTKLILDRGGSSKSPTVQDETLANLSTSPDVLLPTLRVTLKGNRTEKTARAIIDTGSQRSYILHSTSMEMEYEQSRREFFRHSLFGGSSTDVVEHEVYTIHLSDINNSYRCEFEALGQPLICGSIPPVCPRSLLEGSEELDVSDLMRDRIEVLIGADIAGRLLTDDQRRISSGLVAIRTKLGWTVMGKIPPTEVRDDISSLCVTTLLSLDLENLWKLDAIGVSDAEVEKKTQSLQAEMEEHFAHTTTRDIEGRYEVALPWVQDKERIPSNRDLAENQLRSVRRKLEEVGDMKEYGQIFEEWMKQGIIEYAREDKLDGVHYLPHRPVYKRNSQTSRIRPVFKASARKRAKVRKCDLSKLAYELGEVVPPESRIVDLKRLILNSQSYEEEFAKQLLETLIEEREQTERAERERMEQTAQTEQAERIERERIEDRKRIEDRERIERKEQMVMEFELEKLRIQTTRGNNDTSRSTSNDAHYEIRKLMPKYESKDNDLSFYLILFERQAKRLGLDEDQWAFSLLGLLPYEMTQLIARETEEQSGDYRFVKRLLLKRYKLSPEQFRQKFEKHERSQKGSWRDFAFELRGYFNEWIEGMNVENFDALKDLSVTNQLKKKVPNVLRNHLIDDWTKLNNPDELADKLDEYENVRTEMGPPHWNAKHLIPPSFQQKSARFPNQSEVKETKQGTNVSGQDAARNEISETYPNTLRRMVNRAIRNDKGEPKCFNCNQFGHIARDCPAPRTTLTCRGCGQTGHKERNCTRPKEGLKVANLEVEGLETVPPDVYLKDVKIDNKETVKAMIDTGSSSCLMRESVARRISVDIEPDSTSLYGIGNQTAPAARTVGKTTVDLEIDGIVGREITVFIVNDDAQPYDLLIGRTWTDLPYVSFARIGKNLHIGYSSEFPFANLQEEIKSRRIELRATETVQLESDSINFTSAITDEVKDGYVLFTGVDDACVDSLLEVVDGKTTVPIISAGKGKLRVRKNQCVGRVELLNLDDIVVNLDVAEDSFQTKNEEKREGQDQMKRKRPILPEDINVNHSLTSKERQEILDVVNEYRDCFALGMEELGCTDVTKMDIKEVDGSKPVCLRPYKTTASEREAIREIVREWKDNGIVTETRSPYASPVLLVRKKTGDHRLVVDYRRLNIQTVKDKFPLPRIDDLLEGLRNAKFFTTLDLAHGYLQIPLTDKAKLKTAFITPDDTGQFERMIFGLANAPAEFQRLMHTVLGPLLNKKAFCYLDDVIIPAKDWREMIERLREVLERIRSAKLTLKPSKCEFGRREVEFLGYVISTGGLKPGPRKIKAIEEFPEPKNVHDIRRFLGLTNFFRRFVKDFARKAEPLSRLTKKGSQFEWKEEQRRSFGGLRKDLVEYPVLAHYNPELKTEVHCDASAEGLAGMVLQMDEDCKWRLVYCVSKKTTEAEKMYHSSKLELMAIVWTLDRLRQFLVGIKFTVVTDCQALVYMNAKKTTNPQIARWYNLIQEYDFEIRHKPGEKMAHVDGMSRAPVDDPRDTMEEIVEKNLEVCLTITQEEQILMIQHSDPELRDLIQIFRKDPCDRTVGEQNRINDYSYRRKSGRGARSRRYPPTQPTTFLQRKDSYVEKTTLHIFCDASQFAYATCIFLRIEKEDRVDIQLIQARTRVAPLKKLTIPRLELLACLIGARLAANVIQDLEFEEIPRFYWTDSTNALCWIQREDNWAAFVMNRVKEIHNLSSPESWRHIPGRLNPADLPSRGCSAETLKETRWWEGPAWLKVSQEEWPKTAIIPDLEIVYSERRKTILNTLCTTRENENLFGRYSHFLRIVRITAWIYRFFNNAKIDRRKIISKDLSTEEITKSEIILMRLIQRESFSGHEDKKLQGFKLLVDSSGILRIKTKICRREDFANFRMPILLPSDHFLVSLLIRWNHETHGHAGLQTLLGILRENYWILRSRKTVKKIINQCIRCKRFTATPATVESTSLPEDRVRDAAVFEIVGVDLTGHLILKNKKKAWIVIFTCAVYRGVHLELVTSLSMEAFLQAFRRFIARRGRPLIVYSDNGTNFKGMANALKKIDFSRLKCDPTLKNITWKFIPPGAPWWGGWWERLIGMMKQLLFRILGQTSLGYEELSTMMYLRERFRIEYFGFLRQETRRLKTTIPFKVGDMVLIGQESLKRLHWPLARIIQLYPGKDGLVRVAKVKTSSGDKIRPIQKLYNLEITPEIRCRDPLTERFPTQEVRLTTEEDPLTSQQEQHHIDTPTSYGRPIKRPIGSTELFLSMFKSSRRQLKGPVCRGSSGSHPHHQQDIPGDGGETDPLLRAEADQDKKPTDKVKGVKVKGVKIKGVKVKGVKVKEVKVEGVKVKGVKVKEVKVKEDKVKEDKVKGVKVKGVKVKGVKVKGDKVKGVKVKGVKVKEDKVKEDKVKEDKVKGVKVKGVKVKGVKVKGVKVKGDKVKGDKVKGDKVKGDKVKGVKVKRVKVKGVKVKGVKVKGVKVKGVKVKGVKVKGDKVKGVKVKGDKVKEVKVKEDKVKEDKVKGVKVKGVKVKGVKVKGDKVKGVKVKGVKVKEDKVKEDKVKEDKVKGVKVKGVKVKGVKVKGDKVKEVKVKEDKVKEDKVKEVKVKEDKVKEVKVKEDKVKEDKVKGVKVKGVKVKGVKVKGDKVKGVKVKGVKVKEDKVKEDKVKEDKVKGVKVKGVKVKGVKVKGDKVKEVKVKEDKVKEDKVKEDKVKGVKVKGVKVKGVKVKGDKIKGVKVKGVKVKEDK
ncbi:hypothetical protein LAZ67_9000089, partial [Cordylochernes scorpioides]